MKRRQHWEHFSILERNRSCMRSHRPRDQYRAYLCAVQSIRTADKVAGSLWSCVERVVALTHDPQGSIGACAT